MKSKILQNIPKLYLMQFFSELIFFIPIMIPFFGGLGFSMKEILMLEGAFAAMLVLFEIPSGYFSDRVGRKKTLILGTLIQLIGLILFVFSNEYLWFFIGELIIGIGSSLVSGTVEALIFESLAEAKQSSKYKKIQGNIFSFARIGSLFSNILGAMLAIISIRLPFHLTLITWTIWFLINLTLIEPEKHEMESEKWQHFKRIFRETFGGNKKLGLFIVYSSIPYGFFFITFWLYQRYMEFIELPIFYFGFVIAAMNIASIIGSKYGKEIEDFVGQKLCMILLPLVAVLDWILLANIQTFWAIPFLTITSLLWGLTMPLFYDYIQQTISNDRRATVLSIRSFFSRGIYFVFSPLLGTITDLWGIQDALLASAILLFIFSGASWISLRKVGVL
ncbi:MAG: MFS transporter [Patescibacteria group bacterium]